MTSTTAACPSRTRGQAFGDAARAEGAKLWSLPAIWFVFAGTLALTIVLALAFAGSLPKGHIPATWLDVAVTPVTWTQCGFFLLGVIASTSEYIGGQIRTTWTAVPGRVAQRLAATAALAPLAFIAALLTVTASIVTTCLSLGGPIGYIDWTVTLRIVLSAAGYLTLMAILACSLGVLIRKAVPTAAILLVYLLIVGPLLQGQHWYFLPDMASYTLWFATVPPHAPPAWLAWLVVVAWALALLVPSLIAAQRRDA